MAARKKHGFDFRGAAHAGELALLRRAGGLDFRKIPGECG